MDTLTIIHEIEYQIGRDLTDPEFCRICGYLYNEPMDTSPEYLIELFSLTA